jgi:hypothetical protein
VVLPNSCGTLVASRVPQKSVAAVKAALSSNGESSSQACRSTRGVGSHGAAAGGFFCNFFTNLSLTSLGSGTTMWEWMSRTSHTRIGGRDTGRGRRAAGVVLIEAPTVIAFALSVCLACGWCYWLETDQALVKASGNRFSR